MNDNQKEKVKNPRSFGLFDLTRQKIRQNILCLEAKLSMLNKKPDMTHRVLAIDLFSEGRISEATEFAIEALKLNENIFNCAVIIVQNHQNIQELEELAELIPQAIILSGEKVTDQNRLEWADYYKKSAMKKMAMTRQLSALRLFDEALKCDPSILGSRIDKYFGYCLEVMSGLLGKPPEVIPDESDVLSTLGVDCIILNPIELELITFQPILLNLSDKKEMRKKINGKDLVSEINDDSVVSLVNTFAAMGCVHLLEWALSAEDRTSLYYPPSEDKCDLMSFLNVVTLTCSLRDFVQRTNDDKPTDNLPILSPILTAILFNQPAIFHYLVKLGYDINQIEENDQTLLIALSAIGHIKGIQFLLEQGALVDRANSLGTTPMMVAAFHARRKIIKCLSENHADVNLKDSSQLSALMHASRFGDFEDLGMSFGISISNGVTSQKVKTIRLLQSLGAQVNSDDLDELSYESRSIIEYVIENHEDSEESFKLLSENIGSHNKCVIA